MPGWSPYSKPASADSSSIFRTCMEDYGKPDQFSTALAPSVQAQQARRLVREMKGNASIDHTWELFGNRPQGMYDILSHRERYLA
eukprot:scaffold367_cov254-Pinguiococcus_pyrenoidosus.AAC.24